MTKFKIKITHHAHKSEFVVRGNTLEEAARSAKDFYEDNSPVYQRYLLESYAMTINGVTYNLEILNRKFAPTGTENAAQLAALGASQLRFKFNP